MDKIVFDIETSNIISDVGGDAYIDRLDVSVVGAYSYEKDEYYCFEQHEFAELEEMMKKCGLLVGFSSKRFDVPVLNKYFKFNLAALPHYDILEEIEKAYGRRISLALLAEANLQGVAKSGHGLDAIEWWKNGEKDRVKEYCKQDVKVTKDIFDLVKKQGYLWIPQRNSPHMSKVELKYREPEPGSQGGLF